MMVSDSDNRVEPLACLFIFGDLQKRQCLFFAKFLFNLPVPVTLKRFLAELFDFNLGISIPFWLLLIGFYASSQACQSAQFAQTQSTYTLLFWIMQGFFLGAANGFHRHGVHCLTRIHPFGQNHVENGIHPLAFFDGNVGQLRNFAFKFGLVVVNDERVFENRHFLLCPVGEVTNPKFFVCHSQQLKNFAAVFNGALDVHKARHVQAVHIFFPREEQQHIVPLALHLNHHFAVAAAVKLIGATGEYTFNRVYRVI